MIKFDLILIPFSTICSYRTDSAMKRNYLVCYIFGVRVASFHLDR